MTRITFKSAVLASGATTSVATAAGDIVVVGSVDSAATVVMPSQQTTVTYFSADNPTFTRAIRAGNSDVSVVRSGAATVAWSTELLVKSALLLEQTLTWDTFFGTQPEDATTGYYGVLTADPAKLPTDGDTVTINSIVYTFKDSIGSTAGYVKIDATGGDAATKAANTLANLAACIGGTTGAGTTYIATAVSPNASVSVLTLTKTKLTIRAKAGITNVGSTSSITDAAMAWGATTLATPYSVSFIAKAVSELTPLVFSWHESADGATSWTAAPGLVSGGIYNVAPDGTGTQSVLTITPTNLDKTGYHYKCVVSDSATSTLTATTTQPADGDTVVIGGITYTFKTVLGATAGNVLIGATVSATISNLSACIAGGTGGGSLYVATAVSPNVSVSVVATGEDSIQVAARTGMTAVALSTASAGTARVSWSQDTIPNTVTSEIVHLTVL